MTVLLLLVALPLAAARDSANCTSRTTRCNGVMCQDLCDLGTVVVDPWVSSAMAFIRELQRDEPLVRTTMIGTHNSAISQAYGFGIEQDYIHDHLLPDYPVYTADNLGEGVCQTFSVLDQLRMGLRHIEIDINSGYFNVPFFPGAGELDKLYVCHSPIPLDPALIVDADAAARRQNITLGWNTSKLSCIGTNVPFQVHLREIRTWMDAHPEEVVMLYIDAKPESVSLPAQVASAYDDMQAVFGELIWSVADGDPRLYSRAQMLAKGKRVIFEDHDDGFKRDPREYVFTPALWQHQMGSVGAYPDCTIEGESFESWYAPVGYGADANASSPTKSLVRGLGWGRVTQGDPVANAMDCAVSILSPNYFQPADVEGYAWAVTREGWAPGATGCMALLPCDGKMSLVGPCGKMGIVVADGHGSDDGCKSRTPIACRRERDDTAWAVSDSAACPAGFIEAVPTNGYALRKLAEASAGRAAVFLDVGGSTAGRLVRK